MPLRISFPSADIIWNLITRVAHLLPLECRNLFLVDFHIEILTEVDEENYNCP